MTEVCLKQNRSGRGPIRTEVSWQGTECSAATFLLEPRLRNLFNVFLKV